MASEPIRIAIRQVQKEITVVSDDTLLLADDGVSMGKVRVSAAVQAPARAVAQDEISKLNLGTAATADASSFATASQGTKADTAVQPDDLGTAAAEDADAFATAAQGEAADSALQSVVAGDNMTVDTTDPRNPVVSVISDFKATLADAVAAAPDIDPLFVNVAYRNGERRTGSGFRGRLMPSEPDVPAAAKWQNGNGAWYRIDEPVLTPEMLGARRDGIASDTAAFNDAQAAAAAIGSRVASAGAGGGYRLTGTINILVPTDIDCPLIIPQDTFAHVVIGSPAGYEPQMLEFASLGGLTEGSSRITGLPADAAGRYLWIESDEVLTERLNPPGNIPYYKNSAVYVTDPSGGISPALDASYAGTGTVTVKLWPRLPRLRVNLGSVRYEGTGGVSQGQVRVWRDNVHLSISSVESANPINTHIAVGGNGSIVDCPQLYDANLSELGYGISIGLSCNTIINGGAGGNCRHDIAGRHGANVTVNNFIGNEIDAHWGNGYVLNNCWFKTVLWSGFDLAVHGGGCSGEFAIQNRSDVSMARGRLIVDGGFVAGRNCTGIFRNSQANTTIWSTPRRCFDSIVIRDVEFLTASTVTAVNLFINGLPGPAVLRLPDSIFIDNVRAPHASSLGGVSMGGAAGAVPLTQSPYWHVRRLIASTITYPFTVLSDLPSASTAGITMVAELCLTNVRLRVNPNTIERALLIECAVTWLFQSAEAAEGPRGIVELIGGTLLRGANHTLACAIGARGVAFLPGSHAMPGGWAYSIGNRALIDATNYPDLEYYVDPDRYIVPV